MDTSSQSIFLTIAEMATEMRMAPKTLRNHISAGDFPIPSFKIAGKRLFRRADLMAFAEGLETVEKTAEAAPATALEPRKRGKGRPRLVNQVA